MPKSPSIVSFAKDSEDVYAFHALSERWICFTHSPVAPLWTRVGHEKGLSTFGETTFAIAG